MQFWWTRCLFNSLDSNALYSFIHSRLFNCPQPLPTILRLDTVSTNAFYLRWVSSLFLSESDLQDVVKQEIAHLRFGKLFKRLLNLIKYLFLYWTSRRALSFPLHCCEEQTRQADELNNVSKDTRAGEKKRLKIAFRWLSRCSTVIANGSEIKNQSKIIKTEFEYKKVLKKPISEAACEKANKRKWRCPDDEFIFSADDLLPSNRDYH